MGNLLSDTILPYIKTNMKPNEIISVGTKALGFSASGLTQIEFPVEGVNASGGKVDGKGWVLQFEAESLDMLHNFIFNNEDQDVGGICLLFSS